MRLLIIDGNSILNRAYYGIRALSNSKGVFTNAILGFINIYLKQVATVKPDGVAVAWDLRAPTFRHKMYDGYKAQRKGMPDELAMQLPYVKELLGYIGVHNVECEGFEADDILGTLANACCEQNEDCFLVTGDRDSLQLVNDCVTVRLATTKETIVYTPEKIMEVYGVSPAALIEVKALMGDTSDNIPGIKGIGEKTALFLIKEHGSLDGLYEALPTAKLTPSVRAKLEGGRDDAYMSRTLAIIKTDVPIETEPRAYLFAEGDPVAAKRLLRELEMTTTIDRLKLADVQEGASENAVVVPEVAATEAPQELTRLTDLAQISEDATLDIILNGDTLSVYTEGNLFAVDKSLVPAFLTSQNPKRTFESKMLYRYALSQGIMLENLIFAVDIAAYLLNPNAGDYSIRRLCDEHHISLGDGAYAELAAMPHLCDRLLAAVRRDGMEALLCDVELPLAQVLASMELHGVAVDADGVRNFGDTLTADIAKLEQAIHEAAGHPFNIGSPKQLGEILFTELGLPHGRKTKSGYSTNAEVLENLRDKHPIVAMVLEWRKLSKLNSTYVEGLLKLVDDSGRVHSIFKQTETRTGRISSTEPNIQNIPIRTELGRNMRRFFVAAPGYELVDADYSQIELRVLAHISEDETMIEAFKQGADIHTITASQVFGLAPDMVPPEMRSAAKAVNFGIVYGIGAFSLSQDIGVTVAEADRYIKGYLDKYHGVREYMERTVERGKTDGYVTTMFGRRRYVPDLAASNKNLQAFGKRVAMNTPIQGSAADIIKIAMVRVQQRLAKEKLDARLILQVHDELIVEAKKSDVARVCTVLQEEMQGAATLKVPLIAEVATGKSWYEAH